MISIIAIHDKIIRLVKMSFILRNIPNLFTIINCFFGFSSILASIQAINDFYLSYIAANGDNNSERYLAFAGFCIVIATIFDFFDGFLARRLNVSSEMGKEMDSFSDLVSFGIAPGVLFFTVTMIAGNYIPDTHIFYKIDGLIASSILPHLIVLKLLAFVFPTCVLLRLARFNINANTQKNTNCFQGIPSTFGGGYIAITLCFNFLTSPAYYFFEYFEISIKVVDEVDFFFHKLFQNYFFLVLIYLIISFLMISKLPYLKFNLVVKKFTSKKFFLLHIFTFIFLFFFLRYALLLIGTIYLIVGYQRKIKQVT